MSQTLRVGLDLDGSLESLGNSMIDLADALEATGECELVRFRTLEGPVGPGEPRMAMRPLWAPWWRRSRGRAIDDLLPDVDVVHVAGLATPPTRSTSLVISVDDLRPLRAESRTVQRIAQLRRAVDHGALLVASSHAARHEVQELLKITRSQVVVVPPAVPLVLATPAGMDLVVNVTGLTDRFLHLAPSLVKFTRREGAQLVALTSSEAGVRVRSADLGVVVRPRSDARDALAHARVVLHLSDGARFPSFAIAALAAGVPTIARATAINRELLAGAALLATSDEEVVVNLEDVWSNESRRAIMVAAGRSRAVDFAPSTASRAYLALYRDVVRGFSS